MAISFPNRARSFDDKSCSVRFTGYDGMFEIKFVVAGEVLAGDKSNRVANETDYLASFDALRPRILKAATSAYAKSRSNVITLDLGNFR